LIGPTLDVGAMNVNGTVRDLVPTPYTGVDIEPGPNVDLVYDGRRLPFPQASFGTVVCLEVFEHAADPIRLAHELVRVLDPIYGTLLVSARGPGFPFHHPPDSWRFMPGTLAEIFQEQGCRAFEIADPEPGHPGFFVHVRH